MEALDIVQEVILIRKERERERPTAHLADMVAEETNKCHKGIYKNNEPSRRNALVCVGGFGQPRCKYYNRCKNKLLFDKD